MGRDRLLPRRWMAGTTDLAFDAMELWRGWRRWRRETFRGLLPLRIVATRIGGTLAARLTREGLRMSDGREKVAPYRPTDRPTEPVVIRHRARRLAEVVFGARGFEADFRSIGELCRATTLGTAPRTLRSWCQAEGVAARDLLLFARLLRALFCTRAYGGQPTDYIDADVRTLRRI